MYSTHKSLNGLRDFWMRVLSSFPSPESTSCSRAVLSISFNQLRNYPMVGRFPRQGFFLASALVVGVEGKHS